MTTGSAIAPLIYKLDRNKSNTINNNILTINNKDLNNVIKLLNHNIYINNYIIL